MDENTPNKNATGPAREINPTVTSAVSSVVAIALFIAFSILSAAAVFGAIGLALRVGKWMVLQGAH
jgi:small-conductance mechanosensitive channel